MRMALVVLGILVGAAAFGSNAEAQNYPWCAYYSGGNNGGGENCGFSTWEQCMTTVSGIGGFCDRNTQYVPPHAGTPHPHYRPRHKYRRHP